MTEMKALDWKDIPSDMKISEANLIYRQSRVPRDPYALRQEHVAIVKKIVDDSISELDRLLGGVVTRDNWFRKDEFELVYPAGIEWKDLPPGMLDEQQQKVIAALRILQWKDRLTPSRQPKQVVEQSLNACGHKHPKQTQDTHFPGLQ